MPGGTIAVVVGSWVLLLLLTIGYFVLTRADRGEDDAP
jgi:hypothetical protein